MRSEVELLAFHTGVRMDSTPPSAPGTLEDARCAHEECGDFACCGPYDTITHRTEWAAATDDSGDLAYVIDGELRTGTTYDWAETIPRPPYDVLFEREPHEVRAIDVAGNVGPLAVHGARCEGSWLMADAGVIDSGVIDSGVVDAVTLAEIDASSEATDAASDVPTLDAAASAADAHVDASSPSDGAGGGCSTASSSNMSAVLLVLLGLAVRRRRGVGGS